MGNQGAEETQTTGQCTHKVRARAAKNSKLTVVSPYFVRVFNFFNRLPCSLKERTSEGTKEKRKRRELKRQRQALAPKPRQRQEIKKRRKEEERTGRCRHQENKTIKNE